MLDSHAWAPSLLALGAMLSLAALFGRETPLVRVFSALLCVFLSLRYIWWRFFHAMPEGQALWQQEWAWIFFIFESCATMSSIAVYLFMSRTRNRAPDADATRHSVLHRAPVDVFIATYNEGHAILERTIVGALAIEHPDLRVFVLDDGARDWVRDLAAELGALYVRRVKGRHAKAGNVNNGLHHALSIGRRPDFLLLLDADFVPNRKILMRTLGLFEDARIGIVQTPQHFFNPDPIQSNLLCAAVWPDEQRFFFNSLLASKDAWGAAFCCGTSAVFRVAALEACGGMAIETVTEDMLTTFKMEEYGYRTIFLNEPLSLGLAPEGIREYVSQRARWCLGAMQQIYTRWSFAGPARLRLINRLSSLDTVFYWSFTYAFKLMMITAPLVYWWTGTAVISSDVADLVTWLAPMVLCSAAFMAIYAENRVLPVMTDVTQLLCAFAVTRTVATALVRPFGHPFKVTAKGLSSERITVQWNFFLPFSGLAMLTLFGMLRNISPYSPLYESAGYATNMFWSLFNIATLMLAAAVSIELPRKRAEERFASNERARVVLEGGSVLGCSVADISLGGARLVAEMTSWSETISSGTLLLGRRALCLPFRVVRRAGEGVAIRFDLDAGERRALIVHLFTGAYRSEVPAVDVGGVFGVLFRVLFA